VPSRPLAGKNTTWNTVISCCVYGSYVIFVSGLMLVVNAVMCLSIHSALMLFGPEWITENPVVAPRAAQLFFFIVPVLLMLLEWNLIDRIYNMFHGQEKK
jgi:hypothetical protein